MQYKSAKQLILHTCEKYWDAKTSYKKLIIYCFMEQGYQFPLTIDAILHCYSTETIRRTFQELKSDGEIQVSEETQAQWNKEEVGVHNYYHDKKVRSKRSKGQLPIEKQWWRTAVPIDSNGQRVNI